MKLKIQTAVNIIMENNGSIPAVFCGLDQKEFVNICIDGNYEELNECTVIKQENS